MTLNRKDTRHELAMFLGANMPTPKLVLPSLPATFKGQAPLVCIVGAPTDRKDDTAETHENKFGLSVRLVVLYYIENDTTWTPEMAEDQLDHLEYELAAAVKLANTGDHTWRALSRQGYSQIDPIKQDGVTYLQEAIYFIAEVDG
jgi:hypothetical protein